MKIRRLLLGILTSVMFFQNIMGAVGATTDFSDVPPSRPDYTAIMYLKEAGIVQGYPDGSFRPDQSVKRGEVLKIILPDAPDTSTILQFKDTDPKEWYVKYIAEALKRGIVRGYPDGTFKPGDSANLVECLKMLLLGKSISVSNIVVNQNLYADAYSDQWYSVYLQYAKDKNLINADSQNKIYPGQLMTRGKMAEILYRLLYIEKNGLNSFTNPSTPEQNPSGTQNTNSGQNPNPVPTPAGGVSFTIDPTLNRQPISPYIYGNNDFVTSNNAQNRAPGMKMVRFGGNRWTAYNWENNASNAGTDYGPNSSDGYLSDSEVPGDAVKTRVNHTFELGADALVTIPIVDYVTADKNGLVNTAASDSNARWKKNFSTTPGSLPSDPNLQDGVVYQDQFVKWLQNTFQDSLGSGRQIFYSLDNEPALWPSTHPLVHPNPPTYAEMAKRTTDYAGMIKKIAPNSLVFGAVAYGYYEFVALQGAPDANGRDYLDFFLDNAKEAENASGKRLVDVLDLHWYPEAQGGGVKISSSQNANPSDGEIEARVQAPRSLWDPTYVEDSWIANDVLNKKSIQLIPWIKNKFVNHYPGTKLAFTEYNYGGADHISGGIAQADVLGIFGREGVFAATLWPFGFTGSDSYIFGAYDLYLNYDGNGSSIGDVSVSAQNSDIAKSSVYAFTRNNDPKIIYILAINKTKNAMSSNINVVNAQGVFPSAQVYQLTQNARTPKAAESISIQNNQLNYTMPSLSVSLLVLKAS